VACLVFLFAIGFFAIGLIAIGLIAIGLIAIGLFAIGPPARSKKSRVMSERSLWLRRFVSFATPIYFTSLHYERLGHKCVKFTTSLGVFLDPRLINN
jgi:hypothetical protein